MQSVEDFVKKGVTACWRLLRFALRRVGGWARRQHHRLHPPQQPTTLLLLHA